MKKLFLILMAAIMVSSTAACSANNAEDASQPAADNVSTAEASPEVVEEDESGPESLAEAEPASGAIAFPEFDGFTKTEQQAGAVIYSAADGSTVAIQSTPADEATLSTFRGKDADFGTVLNEQMEAMLTAMMPGSTISGEYADIEGKTVFTASMTIPKNEEAGIPMDVTVTIYMVAGQDAIYNIAGTDMGTGVSGLMEELVKIV